jgi:site-specific recombinase XerD
MKDVKELADRIAQLMREAGVVNYGQTRHIFKQVRQSLGVSDWVFEHRDPLKCLSHEDLRDFLVAAYRHSESRGLLLQTLYETAVRISEFAHLQVADFSHDQRIFTINRLQGAKDREVPVTVRLADKLHKAVDGRTEGPLFRSKRRKAYTPRRIQQIVNDVANEVGIKIPVTPYTLRYTRATDLAEAGMAWKELQQMTGGINRVDAGEYQPIPTALTLAAYDQASQEVARRLDFVD